MTKSKNITARPCEAEVWVRALCAAISAKEQGSHCIAIANGAVNEYAKAKFSDEDEDEA
jgi:hypothetical protein